jgi:hypothetical protein
MAALPSKYEIEPMHLASMRQNGVRLLDVQSFNCRHEVSTSTPTGRPHCQAIAMTGEIKAIRLRCRGHRILLRN